MNINSTTLILDKNSFLNFDNFFIEKVKQDKSYAIKNLKGGLINTYRKAQNVFISHREDLILIKDKFNAIVNE